MSNEEEEGQLTSGGELEVLSKGGKGREANSAANRCKEDYCWGVPPWKHTCHTKNEHVLSFGVSQK